MPGSKKLDSAHRGRHIAESSPLLEFTLFPKLPKHIRVMIWETTLTPRIVEIYRCGREEFFTCVPCPSALEIYQDSRAAVIQHYPLCFGTFWYPPQIRFNFSLDIIYLDFAIADELPFFFAILSRIELAGLRYLAFDMTLFVDDEYISAGDNYHYQDKLLQGLRRLGNVITGLEQLIEIHDVRVWAEHCHWDVCKDDYKSRAGGEMQFFKKQKTSRLLFESRS
ncbi:hypothetical protein N431DRAFT_448166 [Stipitochalara longipes BDJ]|nr:hypothetical protein N431DRAFT_448166 [Stipitochalara longipes BDJ]